LYILGSTDDLDMHAVVAVKRFGAYPRILTPHRTMIMTRVGNAPAIKVTTGLVESQLQRSFKGNQSFVVAERWCWIRRCGALAAAESIATGQGGAAQPSWNDPTEHELM
jgi:hypothetical protein